MMNMKELESFVDSVDSFRDYINDECDLFEVFSEGPWLQMCSCLDVLGDTSLAIDAFLDFSERSKRNGSGENYLRLYGLLQSLFVQQDAVKHLSECFDEKDDFLKDYNLSNIRTIRNISVGHPTKRGEKGKGKPKYGFITRMSLTHDTFEINTAKDGGSVTERHLVPELIRLQLKVLNTQMKHLLKVVEAYRTEPKD